MNPWGGSPLAIGIVMFVALTPGSAESSDHEVDARPPYVRVFSGVGVTRNSDLHIRQPSLGNELTFEDVSWEHRSLTTSWTRDSIPYMGMRAGFFLKQPQWLGVSFEAIHFKILAETEKSVHVSGVFAQEAVDVVAPLEQFVEVYQVTNGVNLFLANLEAHRGMVRSTEFPRGRFDLYGGGGAGVTMPFTKSVIAGESRGQYELGRVATQLMAGVAWRASPRWDVSVEYKHTVTTVDGAVARGDSESRIHTNHIVVGLAFQFGA